jgi:hypothetical protein
VVDVAGGRVEVDVGIPVNLKGMGCSMRHNLDGTTDKDQVTWLVLSCRDDHQALTDVRVDPNADGGGHF